VKFQGAVLTRCGSEKLLLNLAYEPLQGPGRARPENKTVTWIGETSMMVLVDQFLKGLIDIKFLERARQ